jgi:RarD protein
LALYRAILAVVLIGGYLLVTGQKIPMQKIAKEIPFLLISGMAMGLNWVLLFEAYNHTTVSIATLSYYFAPVIVTIACPFLFREKLTAKQIICFVMSTAGIVLITGISGAGEGNIVGILFGLGAAVLYATVILINKFIKNVEGIHRTFLQFVAAVIVLLPYVLFTSGVTIEKLNTTGWINLLIVGIVHTGLTYCMYFSSLKGLPGQKAAILSYIDPLVAVLISVTILGETMTIGQVIGGSMILGFTLWNEIKGGEKMIDLHTHTTHSDGKYTVGELLAEAERTGIRVLSITDHNKISAYDELKKPEVRALFQGEIITGVEITTTYKGETIEVLGYHYDMEKMIPPIKKHVLDFETKQQKECELIKEQYQKRGVLFDETKIVFDPQKGSSREAYWKEVRKYEENRKFFLCEESIDVMRSFTRNEVYNPKSPLYVDESSLFPDLKTTIDIIHQAGGIAFLAHVFVYSPAIAEELITILDSYELDGVECFHSQFSKEQSEYLVELCKQRGILMSGGSDFHGLGNRLGVGRGDMHIPESILHQWKDNKRKEA